MTWWIGRDAVTGYVYQYAPSVERVGGPERVVTDQPHPDHRPGRLGFAPTGRHRRPGPADMADGLADGKHRADVS